MKVKNTTPTAIAPNTSAGAIRAIATIIRRMRISRLEKAICHIEKSKKPNTAAPNRHGTGPSEHRQRLHGAPGPGCSSIARKVSAKITSPGQNQFQLVIW